MNDLISGFERSWKFINSDISKVVRRSSAWTAPPWQNEAFWFAPSQQRLFFCLRSFGLSRCQRDMLVTCLLHCDLFAPEFPCQSYLISCLPLLRGRYPFQLKGSTLAYSWAQCRAAKCINLRDLLQMYLLDSAHPSSPRSRCLKPPLVWSLLFTRLGTDSFLKCKIPLGP